MVDADLGKRIVALGQRIVANFNEGHWREVGLLSGQSEMINGYPRLLRSLAFGDDDYSGNVLGVLQQIADEDRNGFREIEQYVNRKFPADDSEYISATPAERKITFAPNVFKIPDESVEPDLIAVMMPFSAEFKSVYRAIQKAARSIELKCLRADDIWEDSTIIQDIFNLVFRAHVVVVDFTGRNPNVMYETGIAHTLGKHVVPITQSFDDVPFDLKHHRALKYLPNDEGLERLQVALEKRLQHIV